MKGDIQFSSSSGKGSVFWVEFPACKPVALIAGNEMEPSNVICFPHILHAENDGDFCQIIAQSLQEDVVFHSAATVTEASELLKSRLYDLLILDLQLGDGNGLELLDIVEKNNLSINTMILSASEADAATCGRVNLALVKSRLSDSDVVKHIVQLTNPARRKSRSAAS